MLLESMAASLGLSSQFLYGISLAASHRYKTYSIPKRAGGSRTIFHPSRELKAAQRWLVANYIARLPVHRAATAYRTGLSTVHNAMVHAPRRFLLRMDFINFFPSIKRRDIEAFVTTNAGALGGLAPDDILHFCNLVCREDALVIGAPTSPSLSNAICNALDGEVTTQVTPMGVTYTRYADDLFFSCDTPDQLAEIEKKILPTILKTVLVPRDLALNPAKTRHSSRKRRRRITGLVLTTQGTTSLGRDVKRRLSARVHQHSSLNDSERKKLAGWLAYAQGVEPSFIQRLYDKYGARVVDAALRL